MKILLYTFLGFILLNTMKDCEKEGGDFKEYKLGETFEIMLNESVEIESENMIVTFSKKEESRCPMNTNCIRAGEAKATFDLLTKENKASVTVEAKGFCYEDDGSCGTSATANGLTVKLLNVYPYPGNPEAGKEDPVIAKIVVSK